MTQGNPPAMTGVVDGLLAELEQVNGWIEELERDLKASRERRIMLAQALDSATAALERNDRLIYEHRIKAMLGDVGRAGTGRPATDGRQDAVLDCLADWGEDTITAGEVRLLLQRKGYVCGKNYVSNLLKRLEKRGMVLRTGFGRYRVTRLHPHLVARRTGLHKELGRRGFLPGADPARIRQL